MRRLATVGAFAALAIASVAADSLPTCGGGSKCPSSSPCCSQYGQCGAGAYCLGGCDPISSYDLSSCVPAPVCKSANYMLNSLDDVQKNTEYLGDVSQGTNWVSSGTPAVYKDSAGISSVLLTMAPDTVGTLLSSTHYVWYGKISVTMQTSAGQGVVTAFVMMSDVKDEIDFEFVGAETDIAQSNFYWQGVPDYNNSMNLTAANTNTETHVYTVDWQPDSLSWAVDGKVMRTLKKSSTYNDTDNTYHYPQTPSRIQLSLWPAGKVGNPQGTINWAGGLIDWNSQYMSNGYYYAQVMEVDVECYDPPSSAKSVGSTSYVYDNDSGLESSVEITDEDTVLASFVASGDNPSFNPDAKPSGKATASASSASAVPTNLQTVPGINNPAGVGSGVRGDSSGSSGSSSGSTSGGTTSGSTGSTSFSQGTDSQTGAAAGKGERAMHGSAFAILVAVLGCTLL